MAGSVVRRFKLEAMTVKSKKQPAFDGTKPVFSVSKTELDWAEGTLDKPTFHVEATTLSAPKRLAKQVAKHLRSLDSTTEIESFTINQSIPVGPIWKQVPYHVLHPATSDGNVCVSCEGKGAAARWSQLAFKVMPQA